MIDVAVLRSVGAFILWRVAAGAVASIIAAGGVTYFVVDMSLRGIEGSLTTMNNRVGDGIRLVDQLERNISGRIDSSEKNLSEKFSLRFDVFEAKMRSEFSSTRELFARSSYQSASHAMSSWSYGGVEYFYNTVPSSPSLPEFMATSPFSIFYGDINRSRSRINGEIRFVAAPTNEYYPKFKGEWNKIDDLIFTTKSDYSTVSSVLSKFDNCAELKTIGINKFFIQPKTAAVVLDGTLVCPQFSR